jgi:hypothetical protein
MICQHETAATDRLIADALDRQIAASVGPNGTLMARASRQVIGNWPGIGVHRDQRFTAHALVGQLRPPGRITDLVAKRL